MEFKKLDSVEDQSVNFVFDNGLEARYVRRDQNYFICYLSSHTGCNKACRFCHLTQTGQTSFTEATLEEFLNQAKLVLEHYKTKAPAKKIHFNWMARGEPLSNMNLSSGWSELSDELIAMAKNAGIEDVSFKISSIFPNGVDAPLECFLKNLPDIYYSLYSLNSSFRKRWIPKSKSPYEVFKFLKEYENRGGRVVIHHALIKGENDSIEEAREIRSAILNNGLNAKFNLVRYNSFSEQTGLESEEKDIDTYFEELRQINLTSRIVPRVGFDVKASCGMFIEIKK